MSRGKKCPNCGHDMRYTVRDHGLDCLLRQLAQAGQRIGELEKSRNKDGAEIERLRGLRVQMRSFLLSWIPGKPGPMQKQFQKMLREVEAAEPADSSDNRVEPVVCQTCKLKPGKPRVDDRSGLACGTHCDDCFEALVHDSRKRSW